MCRSEASAVVTLFVDDANMIAVRVKRTTMQPLHRD